jgi:hypothetical protein
MALLRNKRQASHVDTLLVASPLNGAELTVVQQAKTTIDDSRSAGGQTGAVDGRSRVFDQSVQLKVAGKHDIQARLVLCSSISKGLYVRLRMGPHDEGGPWVTRVQRGDPWLVRPSRLAQSMYKLLNRRREACVCVQASDGEDAALQASPAAWDLGAAACTT